MKNIKKRFVMVIGIFATFLLPFQVALADPAKEMGCVLRQPGAAKFVGGDLPDKKSNRGSRRECPSRAGNQGY